ncbi:hypothetical protein [Pontiella sulfatireligans]|uniref:PEP-CTERM protein-sorting domain-containing protein n=1 Tax=Pontiella sulfatireligans TaxID=2750658 RepID=A0A6C2UNB8_9BACT|nr:hypothetical protein [Pontiella sulfatireligans]VGO20837.1 hypothetical protein SCARR_02904 [Pontiella sulfatireligans]
MKKLLYALSIMALGMTSSHAAYFEVDFTDDERYVDTTAEPSWLENQMPDIGSWSQQYVNNFKVADTAGSGVLALDQSLNRSFKTATFSENIGDGANNFSYYVDFQFTAGSTTVLSGSNKQMFRINARDNTGGKNLFGSLELKDTEGSFNLLLWGVGYDRMSFSANDIGLAVSEGNWVDAESANLRLKIDAEYSGSGNLWNADAALYNLDNSNAEVAAATLSDQDMGGTWTAGTDRKIRFNSGNADQIGDAIFNFDTVAVIPEPASLGMVAVFGGGLLFVRRRFMI